MLMLTSVLVTPTALMFMMLGLDRVQKALVTPHELADQTVEDLSAD